MVLKPLPVNNISHNWYPGEYTNRSCALLCKSQLIHVSTCVTPFVNWFSARNRLCTCFVVASFLTEKWHFLCTRIVDDSALHKHHNQHRIQERRCNWICSYNEDKKARSFMMFTSWWSQNQAITSLHKMSEFGVCSQVHERPSSDWLQNIVANRFGHCANYAIR